MELLKKQLKELIISSLDLEDVTVDGIDDNAPLFGEGLGLDSIDGLELGIIIKKKYNVKLDADSVANKKHFYSIETLAQFIDAK